MANFRIVCGRTRVDVETWPEAESEAKRFIDALDSDPERAARTLAMVLDLAGEGEPVTFAYGVDIEIIDISEGA